MHIARTLGILALLEIGCGGAVEQAHETAADGGTRHTSAESIHVGGGTSIRDISTAGAGRWTANGGNSTGTTLQVAGGVSMATGGLGAVAVTSGLVEQGGTTGFFGGASGSFDGGGTLTGGTTSMGGVGGSAVASGGSMSTSLATGGTNSVQGGSSGAAGVDCRWTSMGGAAGFLNAEAYLEPAGAAGAPVAYGRALCKAACAQQDISSYDFMYGTCARSDCVESCGGLGVTGWGMYVYSDSHKTRLCASRLPWICGVYGPSKHHPYPALACSNADLCQVDFPY